MEKLKLSKQFASRLKEAMLAAGLNSQRSPSGVCIHTLVEITGYSPQICRKYLSGQAVPEPLQLIKIANYLKVAPGWLLFGESHNDNFTDIKKITIDKNLLYYIFSKAAKLYNAHDCEQEVTHFILELIKDISQINADEQQSKKIIDLAVASVQYFSR